MIRALIILLALTFSLPAAAAGRTMQDTNVAVLRTIDKVSARTRTFEVPVDKTVKFGSSLFIRLRACRKSSPFDKPESAAFLQIWERKPTDEKSNWVFSGWMFASSPALSAMDHPVYDVWVIDCKNAATSSKSQDFSSEKAPEAAPASEAKPSAEQPPAGAPPKDQPAEPAKEDPSPTKVAEPAKDDAPAAAETPEEPSAVKDPAPAETPED